MKYSGEVEVSLSGSALHLATFQRQVVIDDLDSDAWTLNLLGGGLVEGISDSAELIVRLLDGDRKAETAPAVLSPKQDPAAIWLRGTASFAN